MRVLLAALLLALAAPSSAVVVKAAPRVRFVSELKLQLGNLSTKAGLVGLVPGGTPEQTLARQALLEALVKPKALAQLSAKLDPETSFDLLQASAKLKNVKAVDRLRRDFAGDSGLRAHGKDVSARLAALFDGEEAKEAIDLRRVDPDSTPGFEGSKEEGRSELAKEIARIQELQKMLYAQKKHAVLVVLQGMDTAGKDGIIDKVFKLNAAGVRVAAFKKPTEEESRHDFLWRITPHVPAKGMIAIFNRSHYEDILVPTVEKLLPRAELEKRYAQINAWEKQLAENGVTIIKIFPHISKDEQQERLQDRLDEPDKRWKFDPADLVARAKWDKYQKTYRSIFARTDTAYAPWHAVPANKKWYRNLAVARILREALEKLDLSYPEAKPGLEDIVVK